MQELYERKLFFQMILLSETDLTDLLLISYIL